MTDLDLRSARTRRSLGLLTSLIGIAHFVLPRIFDPFNRLGFPRHARTFTYLNGALETTIGFLVLQPHTRRSSMILSACYISYLTISTLRTQLRARGGDAHPVRQFD